MAHNVSLNITLDWIVALVLLAVSSWAVLGNLWIAFAWIYWKKKGSLVPLAGGVTGAFGLLLLPVIHARQFWWVPVLVDLGCGPIFVAVLIDYVKKTVYHK